MTRGSISAAWLSFTPVTTLIVSMTETLRIELSARTLPVMPWYIRASFKAHALDSTSSTSSCTSDCCFTTSFCWRGCSCWCCSWPCCPWGRRCSHRKASKTHLT
ncbi:unnamed protein product, partial [Scytosiphon promiscuus]